MCGLLGFELKKLQRENVSVVLVIVIGLLICGCFALSVLSTDVGDRFSWKSYVELSQDIVSGRLQSVDQKSADFTGRDSSPQAYQQEKDTLSDIYESLLLDGQMPEKMYTESVEQELLLYATVLEELKQAVGYGDYLDSVRQEYEKIQSVSIFRSSDRSSRNAEKTAQDFSDMDDVAVTFARSHGIELLFDTGVMDLLLAAAVFILVDALLSGEIEEKRLKLLLCTQKGREQLAYTKYFSGLLVLTVFFTICAFFRIVLIAVTYGVPDGTIQSVAGCRSCVWKMSIGEGIAAFFLLKLLVLASIYSLVFFLMLVLKNGRFLYFAGFGAGAVSLLFYQKLSPNGYLVWLKWMNPAAFLDTQNILFQYRNLMPFGFPVGYLWIVLIVTICILIISLVVSVRLFLRAGADRRNYLKKDIYYPLEQITAFLTGKISAGGFEFRKWFFYQKGIIAIAVLIAAAFVMYSPAVTRLYTDEEIYYKQYVTQMEGSYSDEKMQSLYEERAYLEELSDKLMDAVVEENSLVAVVYQDELRRQEGLEKTIAYGEYLRTTGKGSFVYEKGYLLLFGKGDGHFSLFCYRLLSVLAMVMASILIWGIDEDSQMDRIITATDTGMKAVKRKKMAQIILSGILIFCIVHLPWIYSVYVSFPQMQWRYTASSLMIFAGVSENISVGMLLCGFYLLHFAALILMGFLGRPLYKKLKRPLPVALVLFAAGLAAAFVG